MSKFKGFCIALIGTNGTGKSTYMKKIMDGYPKNKNQLLLMDDDSEDMFDYLTEIKQDQIGKFKGSAVCYVDDTKKEKDFVFGQIYEGFGRFNGEFEGGLLLIDDAMAILGVRDPSVMKLFKKRRQRKLDIILNCHGASEYPISLFKNTTHFVICATTDSTKSIESRMNTETAKIFVKCINHVNKMAEKNPYYKIVFDLKNPPNI